MSEWKEYKLGDVAEIVSKRVSISNASLDNYISTENMINDFGGVLKAEKLPLVTSINSFSKNDILFSNIRTYFKKVWFSNFDGTVSPDVLVFRADQINCLDKFLFFLLCNPDFTEYSVLTARGAKMPRGDKDALLKYPVMLPSLDQQSAIVSVLSSLDDKIDLLQRQNATLEKMAETLFRQWFVEEAKEGWELGKLSDLVVVKYGKDHKKLLDGLIPVYGSGGLMRHVEKALYNKESVLIPRKGTLSNVMYQNDPFWTVDTMFYTEMKLPNVAKFIYHFLRDLDLASMNVGSAVPSMTTEILNNLPLDIPPSNVLERFEKAVSPYYIKSRLNRIQIYTLTSLRDTLLPKLMNGNLKVNMN